MPEFELAELDYELQRESASVVNVERHGTESPRPKAKPPDRESDTKESDRVGIAGKGNAKAETWKAP
ncbi:hypothetical protein, partial [Streptomyces avermitilis]|uniref:hypothetical protein n=1 Tax=Streptomyces avermitilis TaxID=33903 RepID=UPI001A7E7ED4